MAFDPQQLIENALDALASEAAHDFDATMETWENHKTPAQIERTIGRRVVYVDGDVYFWLNFGTKVRRVMLVGAGKGTHGDSSVGKTRVRVIGSAGGQKAGIIVNKKFEFKGIDAREFDLAIIERMNADVIPNLLSDLSDELVAGFSTRTPA